VRPHVGAHTVNWDSNAVLSVEDAKILPPTQAVATSKEASTANFLAVRLGAAQSIEHEDSTARHKIANGRLQSAFNSADHGQV
jgi:hypothetical protein